jgi:hypothetical protein
MIRDVCLSQIPDPGSGVLSIPEPGYAQSFINCGKNNCLKQCFSSVGIRTRSDYTGCLTNPVLRIRDVYPGSRDRNIPYLDPAAATKNLSIFNPKNCSSRFIPDPDFLPLDPGYSDKKKHWIPDPQQC